jgi:hypothetical protein
VKKRFVKEVLARRPHFEVIDGCFCTLPVNHVLTGFCYERGSGGHYLWRFALPLYDQLDHIQFAFGERLTNGFIDTAFGSPSEEAEEFLRRIEPHEPEVRRWSELAGFLPHASLLARTRNPWTCRGYSFTLVMVARYQEAEEQLRELLAQPEIIRWPEFRDVINRIATDLSRGADVARRTLLQWEAETKARLRIPG